MDLNATITLYGGGPGSGRHPEGKYKVFDLSKYQPYKGTPTLGEHKSAPKFLVKVKDVSEPKKSLRGWAKESQQAVERYKKQIKRGSYAPVFVTHYKDGLFLSDGTHRAMAASLLGKEFIVAHVLTGGKK